MFVRGTLSRGLTIVALATGLSAAPTLTVKAARFDLTPNGVFIGDCPVSGIGCETPPLPLTLGSVNADLTSGGYDPSNPSNTIRANANDNAFSVTLTAIPEPSTWALLLVCFAGLAYAGRRKQRRERFTL